MRSGASSTTCDTATPDGNDNQGERSESMTDIVDVEGSNRLPELAARIKAEHEACTEAERRGVQHAAAAGKLLIEAKADISHEIVFVGII
jgi:hypothetical protein